MKRRDFLKSTTAAVGATALSRSPQPARAEGSRADRPNVLWISAEDLSPDLGCYGDDYAVELREFYVTPNLDAFARQGTRFDRCFTHMGVCAPSRSGVITGCYPTWLGTSHMRCQGVPPPEVKCFPEYLRAAGYYCTNRSKTDYQFASPVTAWDLCGNCDDWRGRAPGQPFFCVINLGTTHESQIRSDAARRRATQTLSAQEKHDPAGAKLPPYYPDTPVVRQDWAHYHDLITLMDKEVAALLRQLDEDGLAGETIVWFWGDHGRGLPRGKRWLYDSGLRAPLLIRVPEKWRTLASPADPAAAKPGSVVENLVAFVDFAPTMLSLCGVPIPKHMQGQAFLGAPQAKPRQHVYGARDRVDEAYDVIRCVRDKRWKYVRNFMPHLPRSLDIDYMNQMPTMQEMRRLHAEGDLKGAELQYFECPKPVEELYDTDADPHEVRNLAGDPQHRATLDRLRAELFRWMKATGDFGLLPECEFDALKRPGDKHEVAASPGIAPAGTPARRPDKDYGLGQVRNASAGSRVAGGGEALVALGCATPGASVAYRIEEERATTVGRGKSADVWQVYRGPLTLRPGQTLHAKACRLGFQDSKVVRFRPGDAAVPAGAAGVHPHWREVVDRSGVIDRVLALKALDGQPDLALPAYVKALTGDTRDESASVRYWAVLGLHTQAFALPVPNDSRIHLDVVRQCLADPAPAVRVAAAHALCDWGEADKGLPVLVDLLKDGPLESTRLHAVAALNQLGGKARPALADIKAAGKGGYVGRMVEQIVSRLDP
jgi:uncharacterized sulfatase